MPGYLNFKNHEFYLVSGPPKDTVLIKART